MNKREFVEIEMNILAYEDVVIEGNIFFNGQHLPYQVCPLSNLALRAIGFQAENIVRIPDK